MTPAGRIHHRLLGNEDVAREFSDRGQLQRMLEVEVALTLAEAAAGVVPPECVAPIQSQAVTDRFDLDEIARETAMTGTAVVPVVRRLTALVAERDPSAARYVHWGATSQDILDTALALQLRSAMSVVLGHLDRAARGAAGLIERHASTPMAGRTWLQHATPITFGLKAAGWLDALGRARARLAVALDDVLVLQLGGASGTLASLGSHGTAVAETMAARLELVVPPAPWHAHRDRVTALAGALAVTVGSAGKIARDLSLLAQTEVGEAREKSGVGRGSSSTMPQKQNPVSASVVLAAATRAPGLMATLLGAMLHEHERGLGVWQAEWDALPDLVETSAAALGALGDALEGLVVDERRMRENLAGTGGAAVAEAVAMALADAVGKHEAHALVSAACRRALDERCSLVDALADDPVVAGHLTRAEIENRLRPDAYLGVTRALIERVVRRWRESSGRLPGAAGREES